ncbi:hypothetical protein HK097_010135 [Rhizophlyctis rosea]|uniref:Uncharacterized protein n=1 Tax=Rhizophlyctis rosea TaxID=64517 RepID=A0AAD5S807_9FUNG|nr:hypothetical protein HK097_010135 [Rhizophlyctis rosea]
MLSLLKTVFPIRYHEARTLFVEIYGRWSEVLDSPGRRAIGNGSQTVVEDLLDAILYDRHLYEGTVVRPRHLELADEIDDRIYDALAAYNSVKSYRNSVGAVRKGSLAGVHGLWDLIVVMLGWALRG